MLKIIPLILVVLILSGCSHKRVMKDCEPLTDGFWNCIEP